MPKALLHKVPSLMLLSFDVISDETCEDGAGNGRLQPRDFVVHNESMLIRDIIIVTKRLRNLLSTY